MTQCHQPRQPVSIEVLPGAARLPGCPANHSAPPPVGPMTDHHTPTPVAGETATMDWGSSPEFYGPAHLFRVDLLARWLARRVNAGRVLDLGCGRGTLSARLTSSGYAVIGLDYSLAFARYVRAQTNGAASVVQADAAALPFANATFDAVVSGEVFEHLQDDRRAAREVARVLRRGGWLAATVPAGPGRFNWTDQWAGHVRRYDRTGLRRLFSDAGLVIDRADYWGFPFMRLYQTVIQGPAIRAKARAAPLATSAGGVGRHPAVVATLGALFRLDPISPRLSSGAGLIVLARKP